MDDEATPEQRLEKFAAALEGDDAEGIPVAYLMADDQSLMVADLRDVVARARAAP